MTSASTGAWMRGSRRSLLALLAVPGLIAVLCAAPERAGAPPASSYQPWVFDEVCKVLARETTGGDATIQQMRERFASRAAAAGSSRQELAMVHEALGLVPSSHVAIFSRAAHDFFQRELKGIDSITAGFFLQQYPGGFFVSEVMTGGPADAAGLARGDRVVALDGVPVADSPRLDGRSDDAHLPDRPTHLVLGEEGETLRVEVRRRGGSDATGRDVKQEISITVASYSSLRGDRGSARIIEREEKRLGYVRLSYMYSYDTSRLLRPLLEETFSTCDGLLLDLRGRGGSPIAMWALMQMTKGPKAIWTRPMILLVDTETRSAKEVFADWFKHHKDGASGPRLVGEKTIGAARGGALHPIGEEFFLLCPSQPFARPTGLERKGVTPDVLVVVERPRQLAEDPILVRGLEVLEQAIAAPSARAAPAVPQGAATRPASQPR